MKAVNLPTVQNAPITDASAWRASDFANDHSWIALWPSDALDELQAAVEEAARRGRTAATVTREDFPLPNVTAFLAAVREEVEFGRGFILLRGIPIQRYDDAAAGLLFRGIGCHIGDVVTQNAKGDFLGHVRDHGYADYRGRDDVRGYQTRARLEFHTDVVDVVGLMCLRAARDGGRSLIVSSITVHNEMLRDSPQLLGLLYSKLSVRSAGRGNSKRTSVFHQPGL